MAQTLLAQGYSPDYLKVLLGGWVSWQSLGYPSETSEAPVGSSSGSIQISPGSGGTPMQVIPVGTTDTGGLTFPTAEATAVP